MANEKISQLTPLTTAAANDLLAIVDINVLTTKKISISDLMASPGNIGSLTPASAEFTDITLASGATITEFSTDVTLSGDSDTAVPTEKAVKAYVDASSGGGNASYIYSNDSYVRVIDDGTTTGYIEIIADGQQVAYFDALATSQRIGKAIGGAKVTVEDLAITVTVEGNNLISLDERIQTFGDPDRAFIYIDQTSTSTVELEEEYVVTVSFTDDGLKLENGVRINEFSSDGTLLGDSDLACPTEKAVKTYVDTSIAAVSILNLGSILSVNGTYAGETITGTVGSAGSVFGYVLYQDTDFSFYIADATSSDTAPVLAIAVEDGAGSKTLLLRGQICDTSWNWSAGLVYLDESLGQITQTPPAGPVIQSIGFALSADTIFFTGYIGYSVV